MDLIQKRFLTLALITALPSLAWAQNIKIDNAWARSTVPGQQAGGAFMTLTSDTPMSLLRAESAAAGRVEIHEMRMDKGIMTMRPVDKLDLPAGKAVELKPGGHHLMLMDLKQVLKAGEKLPITLHIGRDGKPVTTLDVQVEVRSAAAAAKQQGHHHH
ncbi:MAG: hypothetical protein RIR70_514 [Pseudomonadota bacterium]